MKHKQKYIFTITLVFLLSLSSLMECSDKRETAFTPGSRTLLDAHNCYSNHGKWEDRIDRALSCGMPLAIEQDLVWYTDSLSGKSWSIVSHGGPYSGNEPTMKAYFFERIRPVVEKAILDQNANDWPIIVLNLDFKTNEPEHLLAVWNLLGEYEDWLCTAKRVSDGKKVMPIQIKPVLVLTGSEDAQQRIFFDSVKIGEKLRVFGAIHTFGDSLEVLAEKMASSGATNYRRWWNNSWSVVEKDRFNSPWTIEQTRRLHSLVNHAHKLGLWIRFYTLNGHERNESLGWSDSYNFGTEERVKIRWRASIEAGVDFVATDQYELFAKYLDTEEFTVTR